MILLLLAAGHWMFMGFALSGWWAMQGKVEGGRYYLGNHGRFEETTRDQFKRRVVWESTMIPTFVAVVICGGVYVASGTPLLLKFPRWPDQKKE
jgi:hypothetical protein